MRRYKTVYNRTPISFRDWKAVEVPEIDVLVNPFLADVVYHFACCSVHKINYRMKP